MTGFLAASASFANDPAVALEFLTPAERAAWHPDGAVTVVGNLQKSPTTSFPKRQVSLPSDQETTVQVSGVQQATLTGSGQYLTSPSADSPRIVYEFRLIKINNQWRIDHLCEVGTTPRTCSPTSQLLLTTDELERTYQQRNLYFLDPTGQTLVPDPVFVPQNDTNSDLATELVKGLSRTRRAGCPAPRRPLSARHPPAGPGQDQWSGGHRQSGHAGRCRALGGSGAAGRPAGLDADQQLLWAVRHRVCRAADQRPDAAAEREPVPAPEDVSEVAEPAADGWAVFRQQERAGQDG